MKDMSYARTKANRLLHIEALLLGHPEGFTPSELARRLGVNRSTVSRYLADLPGHVYVDDLDGG
jgi:CRISPR-associated endonuclease/helicase Cas3